MEDWKSEAAEEVLNNLTDRFTDLIREIIYVKEFAKDFQVVIIGSENFHCLCPHCKIHAYQYSTRLHKCAVCQKYYFVKKEE